MAQMLGVQTREIYSWTRRQLAIVIREYEKREERKDRLFCVDLSARMGMTKNADQLYKMLFGGGIQIKIPSKERFEEIKNAWPAALRDRIITPKHHR